MFVRGSGPCSLRSFDGSADPALSPAFGDARLARAYRSASCKGPAHQRRDFGRCSTARRCVVGGRGRAAHPPGRDSGAARRVVARGADRARLYLTTRGDERPCGALAERSRIHGVRGSRRPRGADRRGARSNCRAEDGAAPAARALAALRYAPFRRYSAGVLLSLVGSAVEASAYGYVVLLLGGSVATLGVIGFLNTIPNLLFALPAGALAARHDRRTILFVFQTANLLLALALAVLWATDSLTLALLGALAVLGGILGTMSFPAFQGLLATTVPAGDLESAVALNSLSLQLARFVGPALAGLLLAQAGPSWVFGFNAVSFVGVLAALAMLRPARPPHSPASIPTGSMSEAFRFMFGQRSLAGLMAFLVLAGLFGIPPVQFMVPALVRDNLHGGPGTLVLFPRPSGSAPFSARSRSCACRDAQTRANRCCSASRSPRWFSSRSGHRRACRSHLASGSRVVSAECSSSASQLSLSRQ